MAKKTTKSTKDAKDAKETKKLDIEKVNKDPICQKWITYSFAEDTDKPSEWYKEKQEYWEKNQHHLEANGFTYGTNMSKALDEVSVVKEGDLEGCLLVVRIGNDNRPASPQDIELAYNMLNEALVGVKGVRVIVTHHAFAVEKVSLPQLRALQSAVLASTDHTENVNPILRDLEL